MRAHFGLPSVEAEDKEGKPPISVKFEIPYFTTSGIQVRAAKAPELTCLCQLGGTGPGVGPGSGGTGPGVGPGSGGTGPGVGPGSDNGASLPVPGSAGHPAALYRQHGPTPIHADLTLHFSPKIRDSFGPQN